MLYTNTSSCSCMNVYISTSRHTSLLCFSCYVTGCLKDAACPAGAKTAVVTRGAHNVTVTYCCPSLIHEPHVQTVQGATPKDICSCSSHDEEGSPTDKIIQWAELTKDYGKTINE